MIVHAIIEWLWNSIWAQIGIAGLILLGCAALFYFVPFTKARELAIFVAVLDLVFIIGAPKLYMEGVRHERAIWEAREAAAVERAEKARRDAEAAIPLVVPQGPPAAAVESNGGRGVLRRLLPHPRRVPHDGDRYDRDNRKGTMRSVPRDHLFVLEGHAGDGARGASAQPGRRRPGLLG
jgi:hypothetical protein